MRQVVLVLVVACASESGGLKLGTVGTGIDVPPISSGQDLAGDAGPDVAPAQPDAASAEDVAGQADTPPACVASCTGRECGDDACGGSCGSCPLAAPKCGDDGKCTFADCVPDCEGRECGYEMRCGTSCGSCPGIVPHCGPKGLCQAEECVPDCMGESIPNSNYFYPKKVCGLDGCGGLCGECLKDGDYCIQNQCTTPCDDTTQVGCLSNNSKTFISCDPYDGVNWRILYKCDSQSICKTENSGCVKD